VLKSSRPDPWERDLAAARAAYRRHVWWWIDLPLLAGVVLIAALVVSMVRAGWGTASAWADTALFILLLPAVVAVLLGLVVVSGLVYLMGRLLGWLPGKADPVRRGLVTLADGSGRASDLAARTVIAPSAAATAALAAWRRLWNKRAGG
jgi:hypothetical protein